MDKINNDENLSGENEVLPSEESKTESGLEKKKELLGRFIRKGIGAYGNAKSMINTLIDKVKDPILEKKNQKEIREHYEKVKSENRDNLYLFYNPGDGVNNLTSLPEKQPDKEWKTRAIRALGFIDCCAVIFQSKSDKGIGVVHISPYAAFGESYVGAPDLDVSIKDRDYSSAISRTIRELSCERIIPDDHDILKEKPKWRIDKKYPEDNFIRPEEMEQAKQDLKVIIIGGHKDLQKSLAIKLRNDNYLLKDLQMDSEVYDYGIGEKDIFITNDQIFVEDKTNKKVYEPFLENKKEVSEDI